MGGTDVHERIGQPHTARGPVIDLVASKLHRLLVQPGTVRRWLLIDWLARGDIYPIVSLPAPPANGKTTLLARWAELNGQAFAWVPVEEPDNDPKALLTNGAPQSGPPAAQYPVLYARPARPSS